jgi:hypothetical protein
MFRLNKQIIKQLFNLNINQNNNYYYEKRLLFKNKTHLLSINNMFYNFLSNNRNNFYKFNNKPNGSQNLLYFAFNSEINSMTKRLFDFYIDREKFEFCFSQLSGN